MNQSLWEKLFWLLWGFLFVFKKKNTKTVPITSSILKEMYF